MIKLLEKDFDLPVEFDEKLWLAAIDRVTVYTDKPVFRFYDGTEITEAI